MGRKVVALAGGVGGAKLAHGLALVLPPGDLTVIVNIGDDFRHYGLHVSPDLDTVMYTLGDLANPETGWGVRGESWQMLTMLENYGETPWFRLGDRDLGTHVLRTHLLHEGFSLTAVTRRLSAGLGIQHTILPASDDTCATMVDTEEAGTLAFQDYFVRHRWQPTVKRIWYDGIDTAKPSPEVMAAFEGANAVVICPSNPVLSVDPILSLGGLREVLRKRRIPCIAVSPLIKGQAVKGPANKIMRELGHAASSDGLMRFYDGLIDALVVDTGDQPSQGRFFETDIMMRSTDDRKRLAGQVLEWAERMTLA